MTQHPFIRTAAAAAALALAAAGAQAAVIYQQAPAAGVSTAWTSHVGIGQGGYQDFENFSVAAAATVKHVTWRGTYFTADAAGLHGAAPNTGAWTVEFWSGNAAGPLQQLYSQDYAPALVTRTPAGSLPLGSSTADLYDFGLDLTIDFSLNAGEQYWFSVLSKSGSFSPFFSWTNADPNGSTYQRMYDGSGNILSTFVRSGDRAFSLEDGAVPEPASLALVASALLLGGAASARRKSRA